MKTLITGGCGFIGSHLAERAVKEGRDVVVIDNLSTGKKENLPAGAVFYRCDIRDPGIKTIFAKEKPVELFHLAAQINVRKSEENPFQDTDININGSVNTLKHFISCGGRKVVFASTGGAIYGETSVLPTPETTEPMPLSPYGISKLAVEKYLHYYSFFYGLQYSALRLANVYGPRQSPEGEAGVVSIFASAALSGNPPEIFGTGRQTRDFVYVLDVVEAFMLASGKNLEGVFNVGTGVETDINAIFELVRNAASLKASSRHGEPRKGEVARSCLSAEKITSESGWRPSWTIKEGIKKTVDWLNSIRS